MHVNTALARCVVLQNSSSVLSILEKISKKKKEIEIRAILQFHKFLQKEPARAKPQNTETSQPQNMPYFLVPLHCTFSSVQFSPALCKPANSGPAREPTREKKKACRDTTQRPKETPTKPLSHTTQLTAAHNPNTHTHTTHTPWQHAVLHLQEGTGRGQVYQ